LLSKKGDIRYDEEVRIRTSAGQADAQQLCCNSVAEADNPEHI
jgi:hypothetical protein